jgi:hypothetical protein
VTLLTVQGARRGGLVAACPRLGRARLQRGDQKPSQGLLVAGAERSLAIVGLSEIEMVEPGDVIDLQ